MMASSGGGQGEGLAVVVAGHDYVARNEKELSFKRGQRIAVIEKQESGWWMGEMEGRRGLFPATYVRDLASSTSSAGATTTSSLSSSSSSLAGPGRPAPPPTLRPTSASSYVPRTYTPDLKTVAIVRAVYDFVGDNEKKLSFKKGETINVLQKLQEVGWWEGEINGRVGLFPSNYAEEVKRERREAAHLEKPMPIVPQQSKQTQHETAQSGGAEEATKSGAAGATVMAICLYDFAADEEKKLPLKKGELVEVISRASDAWWKGRIDSRVGYFPSSYVRLIDNQPNFTQPPLSVSTGSISLRGRPPPLSRTGEFHNVVKEDVNGKWVVALYDYTARNESELTFSKGDRLMLLEDLSVNWYKGEKGGKVGRFPKNYVRFDSDAPAAAPQAVPQQASAGAAVVHKTEEEDKAERERLEREKEEKARLERERLEREARERAERELKEKMDRARQERERLEKERLERAEKERIERERLEQERLEAERIERERQEQERERLAREQAERERLEKEKVEQERLEKEKAEKERLERTEKERIERERLHKEEAERAQREQEEASRKQANEASSGPPELPPVITLPSPRTRALAQQEQRRSGAFIAPPAPASAPAPNTEAHRARTNSGRPLPTPPAGSRSSVNMRGPAVPTAIPTGSEAPQLRRVGLPGGGNNGSFSSTSSASTPFADPRSRTDSGDAAVLRQEAKAMRHWLESEEEGQLATNFEQLRRLVLEERRERRVMAQRLEAIEERLSKLGV